MPKGYNKDGTKGGFKRGYKQSKEHRDRIRDSTKEYYDSLSQKERTELRRSWFEAGHKATHEKFTNMTDSEKTEYVLETSKKVFKDTVPELTFKKLLDEHEFIEGIHYLREVWISRYRADFLILPYQIYEVFGCRYHQCKQCGHVNGYWISKGNFRTAKQQWKRDKDRTSYLVSRGYTVDVIWEHQLRKFL